MSRLPLSSRELAAAHRDARARTLLLVEDLLDAGLRVPKDEILNPLLWEIGHVAWFQEYWCFRRSHARPSIIPSADALWDSAAVHHDTRWDLPIPPRAGVLAYMGRVLEAVLERLDAGEPDREDLYFHHLTLFHEDMHGEALAMLRQELGCAPPAGGAEAATPAGEPVEGDVELRGGTFELGARQNERFVFDNEQWAHVRELAPFRLARAPVTQGAYRDFVEDGGYERDELWTAAGLAWRREAGASAPRHWRREDGAWRRRVFDRWLPLDERRPVVQVCAHEAAAYCRWAGRRLPTELEWEHAASTQGALETVVDARKRRYPWGEEPADAARAHLDLAGRDVAPVDAFPAGDSATGLRQMLGNVWEWTATPFGPYPGFEPGPYRDYSRPWFGDHVVLRGGSFVTRARLIRNTWRNFYRPHRRDPFAGFRTAEDVLP